MEKTIILQGITLDEFMQQIEMLIIKHLNKHFEDTKKEKEIVWLTRQETAAMLKITVATLNNWTNQGMLKRYRINSRVLYNKHEVEMVLKGFKPKSFNR